MSQAIKVFKFGGASVKDAAAVQNLASIVKLYRQQPLVVVVSAMGKTTNAMERVVDACLGGQSTLSDALQQVRQYHLTILAGLFPNEADQVYQAVDSLFADLSQRANELSSQPFDVVYDQLVPYGELISTTIISYYLHQQGVANIWADARELIFTDQHWRNAHINWEATSAAVNQFCNTLSKDADKLMITQGFMGRAPNGYTTTLGREGSDFSASILAWSLDAESVTIWKDVPGLLNADPKFFANTVKLDQISYEEAIELAYYGATVIHPKTIKPLQNRKIPLYVRSFLAPDEEGSIIGDYSESRPDVPSYIFKENQVLISIASRDFSFIAENNLQIIFGVFGAAGLRINLMQNSAISFSVCVDDDDRRVPVVIEQLKASFKVRFNQRLHLITIRRYTSEVIDRVVAGRQILVEQRSRLTAQLVVK